MIRRPRAPFAVRLAAALLPLALGLTPLLTGRGAEAQENRRDAFPGRRVGGGTRGECTGRLVAHLVPPDSIYAPGGGTVLGVLEGPSPAPRPLVVAFRPLGGGAQEQGRTLPAAPGGVTLFPAPAVRGDTVWESRYACEDGPEAAAADPLGFVSKAAPPAKSLLVGGAGDAAGEVRTGLERLRRACGSEVTTAELAGAFGLSDIVAADWPARLPVRCF